MREHYGRAAPVAEMVAALGCGADEVAALTARYLGCSPAEVLRAVRLGRARAALLALMPQRGTVAEVARSAGYRDVRRFRQDYRKRFGELPSRTLRVGMTGPAPDGADGADGQRGRGHGSRGGEGGPAEPA
ncbi:helix-turn-helix domain-containing protein [Actinomadura parmotrematis]|uniref:Helix-turn-helix domain-containing protein n=1 Tax=Actinomadura parmotrematis TaxID=2864039 RepID=A0ABS7G1X3_9ACTN|nr:helix-turn-helix domain-containing protein [Actinomadura parmotrematis]MBW8486708.1 helix-turn-helix domain-containing protein [Actinomadura parmotrematis]